MPQQNEKNKTLDESMQRAYSKVAKRYPDIKPVSVKPQGFIDKMLMNPQATAIADPFTGNITYNPGYMQNYPDTREATIAHELAHSRQAQNTPWYKTVMDILGPKATPPPEYADANPYYWQPHEMEAFQQQREYGGQFDPITGKGDIQLSAPRKKGIDTAPRMGSPLFQGR